MPRRVHVDHLPEAPAAVSLTDAQVHHLRDVLRLRPGETVELFDDRGAVAFGVLEENAPRWQVRIEHHLNIAPELCRLTVAAAVPKGERADWMVEKLSELGVAKFTPLAASRSVVLPAGENKRKRWERLAVESAQQSKRIGVMEIGDLVAPIEVIRSAGRDVWVLSTASDATPIVSRLPTLPAEVTVLIGPEGGWTAEELHSFSTAGAIAVSLTATVLRIETAAVAAAAIVLCSR
jgi:16S rRNA (uracil1498-N3)-methyltransferase